MRIVVVGAGAMGSVYAALLASAGNAVSVVDLDEAHVDAIAARGLRVTGVSGDRTVALEATTDPTDVGEVDLVVIATKSIDAGAAARSVGPLIGADTAVLTIQNGLGAADEVAEAVAAERLMVGVAGGFGASIVAPGHAHHHGMELVRVGERSGPANERTERIADLWRGAGFAVKTYDDVERMQWEKLICNVCYSGICGLLELTIGGVLENPDAWAVGSRCAQEALDVGRSGGVRLEIEDCETYVRDYGLAITGARPSVLLDLLAGRRCEVEWIHGSVARKGAEVGVPAPANELVNALVLAKQAARGVSRSASPSRRTEA